ncbi:glutamate-5-semialdehyde dehydrogenase [Polyangium jinanense]|uniref:glutamate-5-semialdehyde dehydrogenase n=1 Tax=Polyangium jinanense TaxID=2829994 RepID=UPI0023409711|nr:glutamate-5-semialdehyde dehydrogenase [Polyangium jinanense]MDC3958752.1 glutamate-5-semialdehyde dehydrogenase [Polyangium jinanense]
MESTAIQTEELIELAKRARKAARTLSTASREVKDRALVAIAEALRAQAAEGSPLRIANAEDIETARVAGLAAALVDRLILDEQRILDIAAAVTQIASFEDPVGEVLGMKQRPNGLSVGQVRIPLGVIAMIYEARPNVTVDAAALCLKSGNAVLLRGGKEASRSNAALGELVRNAVASAGLPADAVQIVPSGDREGIRELVRLTGMIDLVIPRGGEGLIRFVTEHARVPVIQHYKGVCHLYVDEGADLNMALRLVENGKLSRPGVCNALEGLLVHESVALAFLPRVGKLAAQGLEIRGDQATRAVLPSAKPASPEDYGQEFLAPILAVRIVGSLDEALDHIAQYGSNHTEAICTRSYERAQRFSRAVDASCVIVNASTRFNDGGELGLGAEIGISTTKLHAYGPMGLESLTAKKWIVFGEGQIR